jgi:hypothetical protein
MNISPTQLEQFRARFKGNVDFANGNGNNRLTQPLHDRSIYFKMKSAASNLIGSALLGLIGIILLY